MLPEPGQPEATESDIVQASDPDNQTDAESAVVPPPPPPGGYPAAAQARVARRGIPADEPGSPEPPEQSDTRQWVSAVVMIGALVLLTAVMGGWGLLVIAGLVLMIFLHELGHYVMAKRAGMKVTEFFIGFGPRLWSFRRGETEYGLKLIPAGAYVKIIGMNNLDEVDPADEARAYRQKPFRDRLGVAVAGSAMHFIQALVLIFVLLAVVGVQGGSLFSSATPSGSWTIADVTNGSAADQIGLVKGDKILSVAGVSAKDYDNLQSAVGRNPDKPVPIVFEHDGAKHSVLAPLGHRPDDPSTGFLGISAHFPTQRVGVFAAVPQTFQDFGTVASQSFQGLGQFFSPSGISHFWHQLANDKQKAGPTVNAPNSGSANDSGQSASSNSGSSNDQDRVLSIYGVFRITTSAAQSDGIAAVLALFVLINVFIGIFNLTPLLPFDGGHVVVAVYEKAQEVRKRQKRRYFADVSRLLPLTYVVVLLLAGLFASTLYLDIARPISLK
ncbi:MAG: site-2 protease family protein [Acidimicrobiales bacterium]